MAFSIYDIKSLTKKNFVVSKVGQTCPRKGKGKRGLITCTVKGTKTNLVFLLQGMQHLMSDAVVVIREHYWITATEMSYCSGINMLLPSAELL